MTSPTHALIAAAIGSFVVPRDADRARAQLMLGACCAMLPDLDLLAPYFGGSRYIHRGFTHSITFAAMIGLACVWYGQLRVGRVAQAWRLGCYAAVATASHALADMTTTYPLGVVLLSPFSGTRYHLPLQPISSVPSEALFISVPTAVVSLVVLKIRRIRLFGSRRDPPLRIC